MEPQFAPLTGTIAERYEIRREAGRGGMAVVYLAWDLRHDRGVALKLLSPELSATIGKARFLREIQIAAHLSHPNILAVLDSGLVEVPGGVSLPYYVMPFIEGQNLAELLTAKSHLQADEALRIAAEVADALHYAHGHGVIHRDIKPANILLQEGHALVADFGVARELEGTPGVVTSAGMVIGTVHYMSPEQLTGDPGLDGRSDVYALACVLYEMIAGAPPFAGATPQEICARHLTGEPKELRTIRPEITAAMQQVVSRAMAKSPEDRYASAAEFRDALTRLQNTGDTLPPTPRRKPGSALGLMLAGAVIFGAGLWYLRGPDKATNAADESTRILVVPFQTEGSDSLQPAASFITQALTDRLQAVPDLKVTAYAMVAPYRGASPDSLRRRFPVDQMVDGTVSQIGDSLTVTARLLNPTTGQQLRTMSWTVPAASSATVIVDALGSFVRQTLWRDRQRLLQRQQVHDDSSWALVELARNLRKQANDAVTFRADRQGFRFLDRADSVLLMAGVRDRASTLLPLEQARTAYLRAYLVEYIPQRLETKSDSLPTPARSRALALASVNQFLERHPRNAEALELRGMTRLLDFRATGADSSLTAAIADLDAATTIDPRAARSYRELSRAYLMAGRYPESMLAIERATRVDPFQVNREEFLRGRFEIALLTRDFSKADRDCHTGLLEFPGDERFADCEVELWGRNSSALTQAARAFAITDSLAREGDTPLLTAHRQLWISAILARAGLGDSSDRVATRVLDSMRGKSPPSALFVEAGSLRLVRRDPDSALALVAAAVRMNPGEVPYLRSAPWFETLRSDPRFAAALRGVGAP